MNKCKHIEEFMNIPIKELFILLSNNFICSYCGERVTIDDIINEVKESKEE